MRRMMKEDLFDDERFWDRTTWENDQKKLKALENRVKAYLLDIEKRYQVRIVIYSCNLDLMRRLTFYREK